MLSGRLVEALVRLFTGMGSWQSADAQRFVTQAVPLVAGAQHTLAALTATYVAAQASEALRRTIGPPNIPATAATRLRGVDPSVVYRRPFTEIYTALGRDEPLDTAVRRGRVRLSEIAESDMQQTYAHTSRASMQTLPAEARPSGWRRVLVGEESCAMCVVASTQRYRVADLSPLHPACDCAVVPLFGRHEQVIEPDLLERVHAAVADLTGQADRGAREPDYRMLTTRMTREHGELGPMLVRPLDRFTGPQEIPA